MLLAKSVGLFVFLCAMWLTNLFKAIIAMTKLQFSFISIKEENFWWTYWEKWERHYFWITFLNSFQLFLCRIQVTGASISLLLQLTSQIGSVSFLLKGSEWYLMPIPRAASFFVMNTSDLYLMSTSESPSSILSSTVFPPDNILGKVSKHCTSFIMWFFLKIEIMHMQYLADFCYNIYILTYNTQWILILSLLY